ncbi:MAG: hypothetical protein ABIM40_09820 [Pseudomonadota bacterium]
MADWYEKTWLVVVLLVVFFPAGLYALWKNTGFSKRTKWIVTGVVVVVFIAAAMNAGKETGSRPTQKPGTPIPAQQTVPAHAPSKPVAVVDQGPAALQTLKDFRFQYKGRTIGIEDYVREETANVAPNFRYGWLTRKNPFGPGYVVGYATWASTTDRSKFFYSLWIVDGERIIPVDTLAEILAMDTPGLASADGVRPEKDYVDLFR